MAHPRPRWHQFSLKSLLFLTALVAVWLSIYYWRIDRGRQTVGALRQLGAALRYSGPLDPSGDPDSLPERVRGVWISPNADVTRAIVLAARLPAVEHLVLRRSGVRDADLLVLQKCPSLLSIDLSGTDISDQGLMHLAPLPNLQTVHIDRTRVTEAGTKEFQRAAPNCRVIGRGRVPLSNEQAAALAEIERLGGYVGFNEEGSISHIHFHPWDDRRLALAAEFPSVTELTISDAAGPTSVTDEGLSQLANLGELTNLSIDSSTVSGSDVADWGNMPSLWTLSLYCENLTSLRFIDFRSSASLQSLWLQCPRLERDAFGQIARAENLEYLQLAGMELDGPAVELLRHAPRLRGVRLLDGTSLDDQAWENLGAIPTVISLDLANSPLPGQRETFHSLAHVQQLHLISCAVRDRHVEGMAEMSSLQSLTIVNCDVSEIDLSVLAGSSSLSHLLLYQTSCAAEAIEQLRNLMPHCTIEAGD